MPFQVAGASSAVTGAGSGIGRALCITLAERGVSSIRALDVDLAAAEQTLDLCHAARRSTTHAPCAMRAVRCDASSASALQAAIRNAGEPIDLFCANAGIAREGDCTLADDQWDFSWRINVMQLVWAARELVPSMASRGGGGIIVTASSAGVLSALGSASYAATKHAAVALAEWLAISHADGGISVTCVCPQAVRTNMLAKLPGEAEHGALARVSGNDGVIEPETVAVEAIRCLEDGKFLCLPGGEAGAARHVERKNGDRERWIRGMQRLQRKLSGAREATANVTSSKL